MRICVLAYTFYESDGRVIRYAEALARRGDEVDVFALRGEGSPRYERLRDVNVFRIQKRTINERLQFSYLLKLLGFLVNSFCRASLRCLRRRYDIVHVHSVPDFEVFAALVPKLMGAKCILDIHDIVPEFYADKFGLEKHTLLFRGLAGMERLCCRFADHTIAANHIWQQRLISRSVSPEKCSVFLNYPDPTIFKRKEVVNRTDRFIMIYPGSLSRHQGLHLAIEALSMIAEEAPHADLHIYGSGGELGSLKRLAAEKGISGRVSFLPVLPLDEIAKRMAAADLAVVPKRSDSFGNEAFSTKILEFMSLGVPVLTSNTMIDTHYFDDTVVQFFQAGNAQDLARNMLLLIRDSDLRGRLAKNATDHSEQYSWSAHERRYLALVDSLAGERSQE